MVSATPGTIDTQTATQLNVTLPNLAGPFNAEVFSQYDVSAAETNPLDYTYT